MLFDLLNILRFEVYLFYDGRRVEKGGVEDGHGGVGGTCNEGLIHVHLCSVPQLIIIELIKLINVNV